MILGPVKVIEAGVAVMPRVAEVSTQSNKICMEHSMIPIVICSNSVTNNRLQCCNDILIHNDNMLFILLVSCPSLSNPSNGMVDCSLEDDGVPSYEDTCSFTCNTGYEVTGSDIRTCQSDGSWSGSDTTCSRGK